MSPCLCILFSLAQIRFLVEFAVITLDTETQLPKAKIYKPDEIDELLQAEGLAKKEDDNAMKS